MITYLLSLLRRPVLTLSRERWAQSSELRRSVVEELELQLPARHLRWLRPYPHVLLSHDAARLEQLDAASSVEELSRVLASHGIRLEVVP